jgi:formylglycine-generating enzyme required for sulfatase activity
LFTHALLTGLSGEADADKDGIVTLKEVFPYVRDRVAHTAVEELNREQTPVLLPGEEMLGKRIAQPLAQVSDKQTPKEPKPVQEARARPFSVPQQMGEEITGKDGAPMMLIPEGEFLYGEDNRRLSLEAFYMDKYEVTNSLYAVFLQKTGRQPPSYWNHVQLSSVGNMPVIYVDWTEADAYCRYYGKRLPTEQEWEKAARGTDGRVYPWGNNRSSSYANYGKDDSGQYALTMPVGSYEAGKSPYGVYDLAGNVAEWTFSEHEGRYSIKVVRGGSWNTPSQNVRSTFRAEFGRLAQNSALGFRCVQDESS